jgi:hypothetical protein
VSITSPADGSSFDQGVEVTFEATASDPEDGDLTASIAWSSSADGDLGDGGSITRADLSVGTHTITASVTDSGGATATDQISITITQVGTADPETVTVVDLASATSRSGPDWQAHVTVTLEDDLGNRVSGATVQGSWDPAGSGATTSCVTDANGSCTMDSGWLRRAGRTAQPETTFTVLKVVADGLVYQEGELTSVTVASP